MSPLSEKQLIKILKIIGYGDRTRIKQGVCDYLIISILSELLHTQLLVRLAGKSSCFKPSVNYRKR